MRQRCDFLAMPVQLALNPHVTRFATGRPTTKLLDGDHCLQLDLLRIMYKTGIGIVLVSLVIWWCFRIARPVAVSNTCRFENRRIGTAEI